MVRTTSSTCLAGADDRVRRLFKETMAAAPPPTAPAATPSTILTYTQYYASKADTLVGRYDSYRPASASHTHEPLYVQGLPRIVQAWQCMLFSFITSVDDVHQPPSGPFTLG